MVRSTKTQIGDWIIVLICVLLILVCFLPILNIASRSLSSPEALIKNEIGLFPKGLTFDAYTKIFGDSKYTWSLTWTAILTAICMIISLTMTTLCAYPLTYDHLKGRKIFNTFIILTMYFNAGTIPTYILYRDLNLLNNPLVLILPGCLSVFNMIIMRSFFYGIPDSLRESAEIDGAGPFTVLVKIYLPLSAPVIATLALFYAVGRWNGFSDALMFIKERSLYPIQLLLYNILQNSMSVEVATQEGFATPGESETIKAATVMFATIPILLIYPWLQKYFIAGATLGAIKE